MHKLSKTVKIIYSCFFLLTVLYFVAGELLLPDERPDIYTFCDFYQDGWVQVMPDGSTKAIEVPSYVETEEGSTQFTIRNTLPEEIGVDNYIMFRSARQDLKAYVDGELRTEYSTEDSRIWGLASPVYYVYVPIFPEDSGKTITIQGESIPQYAGAVSEIYYANFRGFFMYMVHTQGLLLMVAVIMVMIGALALMISLILWIQYKRRQKLTSISAGMLVVAFWLLANSAFRQMIFPNTSVIGDLSFVMVALMPFPFATYINQIQGFRYEKFYVTVEILTVIDVGVTTALYVLGISDYSQSFMVMASVLMLLIVVIIATTFIDAIKGYIKEYLLIAAALFLAGAVMVVQIVIYLTSYQTMDISIAAFGLFIMLVVAVIDAIHDIYLFKEEKQQAQMESASKSQFLANMSHEIRTPINAVLGMDTMILRESKEENIRRYAHDIQAAGNNLLSLINDILDFSKIESGKMTLAFVKYDISDILSDVVEMIRPKVSEKDLELIVDVDETLPSGYIGDDVRIKQVLMNLLTNAVKYTPKGSVTFTVKHLGENENHSSARVFYSVKDTGIGIKEEDIDKLTEQFVRIEESRNRNIEGTGLGINIAVSILRMMGGKLDIYSTYGEGSDFSFVLEQPIADATPLGKWEEIVKEVPMEQYSASFAIPDAKLLMVDDNTMNRSVFKSLLHGLQCQIDEADSGEKCLQMVQKEKYDIIFMDHMMPIMDGIETFRHMREFGDYINADTPVVALTANALNGAREQYMAEGFREYLSKPIDADLLEQMIWKLIPEEKRVNLEEQSEKVLTQEMPQSTIEWPFIDGVDWKHAIMKLGNEELLWEMTDNFYQLADRELEKMQNFYEKLKTENAFDAFRIQVHSMKSNAATIGANHVAGLAKYLEYAAKEADLTTIEQILPLFEREWNKLYQSLSEMFQTKEEDNGQKPDIAVTELERYLGILKDSMAELDIDRADATVETLMEYHYSDEEKNCLVKVAECVLAMDTDGCMEQIQNWEHLIAEKNDHNS